MFFFSTFSNTNLIGHLFSSLEILHMIWSSGLLEVWMSHFAASVGELPCGANGAHREALTGWGSQISQRSAWRSQRSAIDFSMGVSMAMGVSPQLAGWWIFHGKWLENPMTWSGWLYRVPLWLRKPPNPMVFIFVLKQKLKNWSDLLGRRFG